MGYLENFNYKIYGQGNKNLVFLHGLMGYGANWRTLAKHFEMQFQILLLDQRGHGKSFWPESGYAPENYADDLKFVLDELNWKKIFLVGHSMGGRNALNFAYRYPEYVEKLVIEDIGPDSHPAGEQAIRDLLNLIPVPFQSKEEARNFFQNQFPNLYQGPEDPRTLGLFLYSNLEQRQGIITWRFFLKGILESLHLGHRTDRWHEIQALTRPTLVIRGEKSQDLVPQIYEQMLRCNPHVQGIVIPEAGHWVHADKPLEVAKAIKNFFEDQRS